VVLVPCGLRHCWGPQSGAKQQQDKDQEQEQQEKEEREKRQQEEKEKPISPMRAQGGILRAHQQQLR
jgi:hypothetical protein